MKVQCPSCRKTYKVPEAVLGKKVRCKDCGHVFRGHTTPPREKHPSPPVRPDAEPVAPVAMEPVAPQRNRPFADSQSVSEWLQKGDRAHEREDWDEAIASYTKALEIDRGCVKAYSGRAAACGARGDYPKAIADFDSAIRLDPQGSNNYYGRGRCLCATREYDRAIADLTKFLEFEPDYGWAYAVRAAALCFKGIELQSKGEMAKCLEEFTRARADALKAREMGCEVDEVVSKVLSLKDSHPEARPPQDMPQRSEASANTCWFCQKNPGDESAAIEVHLNKDRGIENTTVRVPRCRICERVHEEGALGALLGFGAGGMLGLFAWATIVSRWAVPVCLLVWASMTVLGYYVDASPLVRAIALPVLAGILVAVVTSYMLVGVSKVAAVVSALLCLAGGIAVGVLWGRKWGQERVEQLKAQRAGLTTQAHDKYVEYPLVKDLLSQGWEMGKKSLDLTKSGTPAGRAPAEDGRPTWHRWAKYPEKLYAHKKPFYCPVCGASIGGEGIGQMVADRVGVVCQICGAWGCGACTHFHNRDGTPSRRAIAKDGDQLVVLVNVQWRHNQCCDCGFQPNWLREILR